MNILNNADVDDDMTTESDDENLEFGTHGKILIVGTENGTVHLVDVKGRSVINSVRLDSAVNSVKFLTFENHVIAGTEDGQVYLISLPDMKILQQLHDSDSSVQCLLSLRNGFVCGKYDGACVWYGLNPPNDHGNNILSDEMVI